MYYTLMYNVCIFGDLNEKYGRFLHLQRTFIPSSRMNRVSFSRDCYKFFPRFKLLFPEILTHNLGKNI